MSSTVIERQHRLLEATLAENTTVLPFRMQDDLNQWLGARRGGVGGSDSGTILGVNPYQGRFELWLNKTGQIPDRDLNHIEAVYWGNRLEAIVCEEFADRADVPIWDSGGIYQRNAEPWQLLSPDRFTLCPETGEPALLEAKTAGDQMSVYWENDATPEHYEAQVLHGCAVTGLRRAWIAVLIGGQHFEYHQIEVDEDLLHDITTAERLFWETHVVGGQRPAIEGTDSLAETLREMWDVVEGGREVDPIAVDVALDYLAAHDEMKAAEKRKAELGNWLRYELGDHSDALVNGRKIFTHRESKPRTFDVKSFKEHHPGLYEEYLVESTQRTLRVPPSIRKLTPAQ